MKNKMIKFDYSTCDLSSLFEIKFNNDNDLFFLEHVWSATIYEDEVHIIFNEQYNKEIDDYEVLNKYSNFLKSQDKIELLQYDRQGNVMNTYVFNNSKLNNITLFDKSIPREYNKIKVVISYTK